MAIQFNPNDLASNFKINPDQSNETWMKTLANLNVPGLNDPSKQTNLSTSFGTNDIDHQTGDPAKFTAWMEKYNDILKRGDGNAAVAHIIQGLKDGTITKEQAKEFAKTVQEAANEGGGGKINKGKREELKDALGTDVDYIGKGKTRAKIGWDKFTSALGSIFGGIFGF